MGVVLERLPDRWETVLRWKYCDNLSLKEIAERLEMSVPGTELRLFGKPEAFVKRRMGVALAYGDDVQDARRRALQVANQVRPCAA